MKILFFSFFLILLSLSIYSQDEDLDVILVSGSQVNQNQNHHTESVQVVTQEKIRESGAKTVSDVLRTVSGVTVNAQSAANANESISMQGLSGDYVKVMIDGVAVAADIDGASPLFQIPVEDIERIEVLSGAESVLYGSDAMGGAINIITKKSKGGGKNLLRFSGSASEDFGLSPITLNVRNYTAAHFSLAGEHLSGSLSGSFDFTPGKSSQFEDALAGMVTYYESVKKRLDFVRGTMNWQDFWGRVGIYGFFSDSYQISNFTKTGFDRGATMEYQTMRMDGGINGQFYATENLKFDLFSVVKGYILHNNYNVLAGDYSSIKNTHSNLIEWESDFRGQWKIGKYNQLLFGLNSNFETVDGNTFNERKMALFLSAFVQDTILLCNDTLHIVPGVRLSISPSLQGSDTFVNAVPKLAFRYDAPSKTLLKFSYGMGYKVPSLKEKYWIFRHNFAPGSGNFILYGNPNLKPEKSHSLNLSVEQNILNLLTLRVSGYFNYINDLIDSVVTDPHSSPQIREYQNIDKAMTYGCEIALQSQLDRFKGSLSYAFTGAKAFKEEKNHWEDMSLRSAHRVVLGLSYRIPVIETQIALNGEWNSPQLLTTGGDLYTPDYLMMGLALTQRFLNDNLELTFRVSNLLNNVSFTKGTLGDNQRDYYGLYDGTMLSIGLSYRWNEKYNRREKHES